MVGHIRCLPKYLYLPKYLPTQLKLIIMCGVSSILSTNVLESALPVYLSFFSLPLPLVLSLSSDISTSALISPFPQIFSISAPPSPLRTLPSTAHALVIFIFLFVDRKRGKKKITKTKKNVCGYELLAFRRFSFCEKNSLL